MTSRKLPYQAIGAVIAASFLSLTLTSSSSADEELPVLSTAEASSESLGESFIEVHEAKSSADGDYTQIVWTMRARGGIDYDSSSETNELYRYMEEGMSGITALDEKNKVRYHPLQDSSRICMCSGMYRPVDFITTVEDKKSSPYWSSFMIPGDVSEITLEVPGFKPARNIPVK